VPGEAVSFSVGSGGGTITGGTATTDASGVAAVASWTLGTAAGPNTLVAKSRGAVGSPATFTATGVAPAPTARLVNLTVRNGNTVALDDAARADLASQATVIDGSIANGTNLALSPVNVAAYLDQGGTSRYENSKPACAPSDILPPAGTCGLALVVMASSALTLPGTGTLVPGPATLRVQLTQGNTVLDVVRIAVTLVNAPVRILGVNLSSSTLPLAGPAVSYTATIINQTGVTLGPVFVQGFIVQPGTGIAASGAFFLVGCGPNPGDLLPGTCVATTGISGPTTGNLVLGVGPLISGNALVPGAAAAMFRVDESFCCAFRAHEITVPLNLGP